MGKGTPRTLIEAGWTLHMVSDVFPADGQLTGDDEWIEYGLKRGWTMLAQDKRTRNLGPYHSLPEQRRVDTSEARRAL
ncbi:hypothetical protein [Micromonospora sp. NPDC002575]|uniref:PIN-like domain-containing protein n=1 Tax=Micromonospora sp. NPDC002575 TaxID=3364222 RepID=UPI00367EBB7F